MGQTLRDPKDFPWPRTNAEITVWVITCKHHDTFRQAPINSLHASASELFDLGMDRNNFVGSYSASLVEARTLFQTAYRKLAAINPALNFRFAYASRGDAQAVEPNVKSRAAQTVELTKSLFSAVDCCFTFIGAAELIGMYRRAKKFAIELPVVELISHGNTGYVVLTELGKYAQFVTDDSGNLRRYLFDSNVRDFLGRTQVNEDILTTLRDPSAPDFWRLNNGVTILVTSATVVGKTLHLQDIQIVNGLQTTESIYRHFQTETTVNTDQALLIKIVVSTDVTTRDRIIQATNNQNVVEVASLRATEKLQRDIEEHLERNGWYYERRKNYYKNVGKPPERFVTPMLLAAGYIALVLKDPAGAAKLRPRFMRNDASYSVVFSDHTPIRLWVAVTEVIKRIEEFLSVSRPPHGPEKFLSTWRNLVVLLVVSKNIGSFAFGISDFLKFEPQGITSQDVAEAWHLIAAQTDGFYKASTGRKRSFVMDCCAKAAEKFGISGLESVGRRSIYQQNNAPAKKTRKPFWDHVKSLPQELVDLVDAALPNQPWKPGVHRQVAEQVGCTSKDVSAAIVQLIGAGKRNRQKDGIVYSANGDVIAVDPDRNPVN